MGHAPRVRTSTGVYSRPIMADQYGQPPLPPEQWSPDRPSLRMLYARYMPEWLGGGDFGGDDMRLGLEAGQSRDPRLPAPSGLDAMREGLDVLGDLGRPRAQPQAAPRSPRPMPMPTPPDRPMPAPSIDELRRRIDAMGVR